MRAIGLVPLVALGTAAILGCAGPSEAPTINARVLTQAEDAGLRVTNDTDGPIAYAVLERQYATTTLAQWGPCEGCTLQAGQSVIVPYAAIGGYEPGAREAIVVWWKLVPDGRGGQQLRDPEQGIVVL